jgi:putative hydrolase of the HAD superfamily
MRPAVVGLVDDVDAFLAEAVAAERPALTGEARWLDILPGLLRRWGASGSYDAVVAVWLDIEAVPGTHDLVRALRRHGVRCCLATNQDRHRLSHMRRTLGYDDLVDAQFVSCELGLAKPDAAYFSAILDTLGEAPERVLFVDDSPRNVAAARALGLAAERWSHEDGLDVLRDRLRRHGLPTGS